MERLAAKDTFPVPLVDPRNAIFEQSGRGNNFAYGYYGEPSGNALLKKSVAVWLGSDHPSMKAYRREAEKCDLYLGGVLFHSLAGGTGSGLTAALVEQLRDAYPKQYIVTATVWPRATGETCLQYYNTCLSLPKLQQNADAIIIYQNDKIASILDKHPKTALSQLFTMEHMNEYIGLGMQQALAPTPSYVFDFNSIMELSCCSMFKFLECDMWPFTYEHKAVSGAEDQWGDICDRCNGNIALAAKPAAPVIRGFVDPTHPMVVTKDSVIKHKSIAIRATMKSAAVNKELFVNHTTMNPQIKGMLDQPFRMVDWNPDGLHVETYNVKPFASMLVKKHITVLGNRTSVVIPLREALDRAELKYKSKKYLVCRLNTWLGRTWIGTRSTGAKRRSSRRRSSACQT